MDSILSKGLNPAKVFKQLDRNGDGKITEEGKLFALLSIFFLIYNSYVFFYLNRLNIGIEQARSR